MFYREINNKLECPLFSCYEKGGKTLDRIGFSRDRRPADAPVRNHGRQLLECSLYDRRCWYLSIRHHCLRDLSQGIKYPDCIVTAFNRGVALKS
jgi:hypothetical protein